MIRCEGNRVAVLVGTPKCKDDNKRLQDLDCVKNNLDQMASYCRKHKILLKRYQSRKVVENLIGNIEEDVKHADGSLFFYFSGHGLMDDDGLYLALARTTCENFKTRALPFARIAQILSSSPAKKKVIFLDCCFAEKGAIDVLKQGASIYTEACCTIAAASQYKPAWTIKENNKHVSVCSDVAIQLLEDPLAESGEDYTAASWITDIKKIVKKKCPKAEVMLSSINDPNSIIVSAKEQDPAIEMAKDVAVSLDLPIDKLPEILNGHIDVVASYRRMLAAYELTKLLNNSIQRIEQWLVQVRDSESTDKVQVTIARAFGVAGPLDQHLRWNLERNQHWEDYESIVEPVMDASAKFVSDMSSYMDGCDAVTQKALDGVNPKMEPILFRHVRSLLESSASKLLDALREHAKSANQLYHASITDG